MTGERVSVMDRYKTEENMQRGMRGQTDGSPRGMWLIAALGWDRGQNSVMVGSANPPPFTMATEWQHGNTRDHAAVCVLDQREEHEKQTHTVCLKSLRDMLER